MHDEVVLLTSDGAPVGTAPRATVHGSRTPLHLAFSCHVQDERGRLLMTRRALGKRSWPGVWTNAFCGHPRPGEAPQDAVARRARDELGAEVADLRPWLPDFRYEAVDAHGVHENEVCPVWGARLAGTLDPDPDEVADLRWVEPEDLVRSLRSTPWVFSPWLVLQAEQLVAAGRWDAAETRTA